MPAMVMEENEIPNGWPLGLGNMNMRFRVAQTPVAAMVAAAAEHRPTHIRRSTSFSSFSSSNFDTESTASFFPDRSKSLGKLIGMKPGNGRSLYFPETIIHIQPMSVPNRRSHPNMSSKEQGDSQGLCVPLLHNVMGKMGRSKSRSNMRN